VSGGGRRVAAGRSSAVAAWVMPGLLLAAASAATLHARRAPGPGGTAHVAVPADLVDAVVDAHVHAPLVVPASAAGNGLGLERPALPGAAGFASTVLTRVSVADGGRRWLLATRASLPATADSVARCLNTERGGGFAGAALRAAGVAVRVEVVDSDVVVTFDRPVFVLPALLAWCPLRGPQGSPTGAYAQPTPGRLSWRTGTFDAPPLLAGLEVRGRASGAADGEKADVAFATDADRDDGATLLAPWGDVLVLVQPPAARDVDAFALADARGGRRAFRSALRADLLVAAWAGGRGAPTEALLPPGVAPARPLPSTTGGPPAQLSLAPLPAGAPRVRVAAAADDPLLDGVVGRLAVLLRGRGALLDRQREAGDDDIALVRWHAPTHDAALALLAFLGERPSLLTDPAIARALDAAALLAADPAARLRAALTLERALLDGRLVVPLLFVDRALVVDPDLHGVQVRDDGVPLLDGAWWGGGR
jgi:hypothetical protein